MATFFYKGLTRNPEIGSTAVWVLPNIWRLGQVSDTKFGTNVSNATLLNAAKYHDYSFYGFWVIKGKPTERYNYPPPPRLGLKEQVSVINKQKYSFKNTSSYETRISDHRHLIYSVMKTAIECEESKN